MIVIACGLSKSGKTTLIREAGLNELGMSHIRGSAVLQAGSRPTEKLQGGDVLGNQRAIVRYLTDEIAKEKKKIVLDGHLLIETTEGPQLVQPKLFSTLPIVGVVFLKIDPRIVSARRQGAPLTQNVDDIEDLTEMEFHQARFFARFHKASFHLMAESRSSELGSILSSMFNGYKASH